jgi:nucleotide-binding universal stress UspA family protein
MKKILIATDFSPCAANAMEYALELAKILNVEVCALHAIGPMEGVNNNTYNAIWIEDYYDEKRQALKDWVANFAANDRFKGVTITTDCEVGILSSVLIKYAQANPVELLIMGTTGASGISGLFGSNANMAISKTQIPTLILPLEGKFSLQPAITLATDYSSDLSAADVNALNELVKAFKLEKLNILYVVEKSDETFIQAGEKILKSLIQDTQLVFNYISDTNASAGILGFVEENATDILCVVKRHHNLIYRIFGRSTINKLVKKTIKAVLVLHE